MSKTQVLYTNHMRLTTESRQKALKNIVSYCDDLFTEDEDECCNGCILRPICGEESIQHWHDLSDSALDYINHWVEKDREERLSQTNQS